MERLFDGTDDGQVIELGDANDGVVNTIVLELEPDGDYNGSIAIEGRSQGFDASSPNRAWYPIPYRRRVLDATASDEAVVSTALTPTDSTLVSIDASGIAVRLVQTADNSPDGLCMVRWRGLKG